MAKATVRKPVTKVVDEGGVTLELTTEEAEALFVLIGNTAGGGPHYDIYWALENAGVINEGNFVYTLRGYGLAPRLDRKDV